MAVDRPPDPFDLIQNHWPPEDEAKFAASAGSLTAKAADHSATADDYRSTIAALGEESFKGLTADKTREKFTYLASRHEEENKFCQDAAKIIGDLGMQVLATKNEISSRCISANADLMQLETEKAMTTDSKQRDQFQKAEDKKKDEARRDIKAAHDRLEQELVGGETKLQTMTDQISVNAGGGGGAPPATAATAQSTPPPAPAGDDPVPSRGSSTGGASAMSAPINPASLMGGGMPQMPQMPSASPMSGGGMPSQLPGQELASKAMDMAHDMGGKDNTFLSDSSVKDLLEASKHGDGSGTDNGSGSGSGSGSHDGTPGGVQPVSVTNPTVAAGPSPATPVTSTPRPAGGPSVAVTELSSSASIDGAVSGLTSAAAGVGGLTVGPAVDAAVASAHDAAAGGLANPNSLTASGGGVPLAAAGTAGISSTIGPTQLGVTGQQPAGPQQPFASPPHQPIPVAPVQPPAPPPPPPVAPPPVTPGIAPMPSGITPPSPALLDLIAKPVMMPVPRHAPDHFEHLPPDARLTINYAASMITQMREIPWIPSLVVAVLNDGTVDAIVIATGDDLSILPADLLIPSKAVLLLQRFHLGDEFRARWAGNADTMTKLLAAIDNHPQLNRSMIRHACAFTRNDEIRDPGVPFTPMSTDAAWAIRHLYTPPPKQYTCPAYTMRTETFTPNEIDYILDTAVTTWRLPTARLNRPGQAHLESASMFASRWSETGEAVLTSRPRHYDSRIAGYLYAATREALNSDDLERASWYAQFLRYQTLPAAKHSSPQGNSLVPA